MKKDDAAPITVGGMPYFKFTGEELVIIVEKNISLSAIKLYAYMRLNCDNNRGISHTINYPNIAKLLKMHRASVYRALADLEDAELIAPRNRITGQTFDLPFCAYAKSTADTATYKKKQHTAKKKYAAEKQNIENVLMRRLTQPEIKRLKEKHGL